MRFAASLIGVAALAALATPAAAQQGPCFYVQPDYKGPPMCIALNQRVPTLGAADNRLMSVQIPRGARVTMCADPNFQGACMTFDQSIPNFAAIGAAGKVSSVASEPAGAPPARAAAPPPPAAPPPRGPQVGAMPPPPPPPGPPRGPQYAQPPAQQHALPGGLRDYNDARETRRVMHALRRECEAGDTRACVQFGIIIGENRERRAQWRQEAPDLFWWER
jgi:hypothetical protein